jgi:integrase/recombinase XerD
VRSYAHDLAVYFRFLAEQGVEWRRASLDLLARYVFWLRRPDPNVVVIALEAARRAPRTVNRMMAAVASFYGFHARCGADVAVGEQLLAWRRIARRDFKPFLHHVSKGRPAKTSVLTVRTTRSIPTTLTPGQVQQLLEACTRLRDRFLIALL